jgi:hypothetical protein
MMSGETGLASYFVWLASLDSVCMRKEFDFGCVDIKVGRVFEPPGQEGNMEPCGWTGTFTSGCCHFQEA